MRAYLLLDAQPAMSTPMTDTASTARMKNTPPGSMAATAGPGPAGIAA